MTEISFNLIDQPWIPVLDLKNQPLRASLREVLIKPQEYRLLAATLPHTNAALYRLLLAILYRVYGDINEIRWQEIWQAGRFDAQKVEEYLAKNYENFDLFSPSRPFYQRQNPDVEIKPANILYFMTGGGNPETLFDHSTDDVPIVISPADAALALLTVQSFSLAGLCHPQLKLTFTDAPCARGAVIFLQGSNLFESLMLNLVAYNPSEPMRRTGEDLPAWERVDAYQPRTVPDGYVDYLTWPTRRVMLFPELIDGEIKVTRVSMAPGLVLDSNVHNPMYHYRIDQKAKTGQSPFKLLRFTEGKALWRDSAALLNFAPEKTEQPAAVRWASHLIARKLLPQRKLVLAAYGMATEPGKSKVLFYRGDQFEFSDDLLSSETLVDLLDQALDKADQVRAQLWGAVSNTAGLYLAPESDQPSPDSKKANPDDVKKLVATLDPESRYWQLLELPFYRFLDELPQLGEDALNGWIVTLRQVALQVYDSVVRQLGNNVKALKASTRGQNILRAGLKKTLDAETKEAAKNGE